MAKSTAVAHTIQGLLKYHGLKNKKLRLPFHDSISVCVKELTTTATVDFRPEYGEDTVLINESVAKGTEAQRVIAVVEALRKLKKTKARAKIVSKNNLEKAKGVGFSAAAFASIAFAASNALNLKIDLPRLSEIARLGAGSASRSLVGGAEECSSPHENQDDNCQYARTTSVKCLPGSTHHKIPMPMATSSTGCQTQFYHGSRRAGASPSPG